MILVLAICFVCPVVEMFDQWDHTVETGNDTEYALVVVALCVGTAYALARAFLMIAGRLLSKNTYGSENAALCFSGCLLTSVERTAISTSPPITTLRI
jgi:hypothetical protein